MSVGTDGVIFFLRYLAELVEREESEQHFARYSASVNAADNAAVLRIETVVPHHKHMSVGNCDVNARVSVFVGRQRICSRKRSVCGSCLLERVEIILLQNLPVKINAVVFSVIGLYLQMVARNGDDSFDVKNV